MGEVEVRLSKHGSFAEFLKDKGKVRIISLVPAEASINSSGGEATLHSELDASSAANYWEELVKGSEDGEAERYSQDTALIDPRYLNLENYKVGLTGGRDALEYVMKTKVSDGFNEYEIILEGKEDDYVSEEMFRRDFRLMNQEGEARFRNRLEDLFMDQTSSGYF